MDEEIRSAVTQQRTAAAIRDLARLAGMRSLKDDADRVIRAGLTTPEEVLRASGT